MVWNICLICMNFLLIFPEVYGEFSNEEMIFDGHGYEVVNSFRIWGDASSYCERKGAALVSIHSRNEYNFVREITQRIKDETEFWIGLYFFCSNIKLYWSDGTPCQFPKFYTSEAYLRFMCSLKRSEKHCAVMTNYNSQWFWEDCRWHNFFVCKRKISFSTESNSYIATLSTPQPAVHGEFSHEEMIFDGHSYEVVTSPRNWEYASSYCQRKGAALVSIHSKNENNFVDEITHHIKDEPEVWIGLYFFCSNNTFYWSDGTLFQFSNFHSTGVNKRFCVHGIGDKLCIYTTSKGNWRGGFCNWENCFVCKRKISFSTGNSSLIATLSTP